MSTTFINEARHLFNTEQQASAVGKKRVMIGKKGFLIVFVLLLAASFTLQAEAQQGCCVNTATSTLTCSQKTQADCTASGSTYLFSEGQTCDVCTQEVCNICVPLSCKGLNPLPSSCIGFVNNVWESRIIGCSNIAGQVLDHVEESITTQGNCQAFSGPLISALPNVTGKVTQDTATGPGVSGATVSCTGAHATTNANGNYNLSNCAVIGQTTISAEKTIATGTETGSKLVTLVKAQTLRNVIIPISLVPTNNVLVTVLVGTTPAKANVTVTGINGFRATAQQTGNFDFPGVPLGQVQITATKSGYGTGTVTFDLTATDNSRTITLVLLPRVKISGVVYDGTTLPTTRTLAATVRLLDLSDQEITRMTASATGTYQFLSVPIGTYKISASFTGFDTDTSQITLIQGQDLTKDIYLKQSGAATTVNLELTVKNKDTGAGVPSAYIVYASENNPYTGSDGKVNLPLIPGDPYVLTIFKDGYRPYTSPTIRGGATQFTAELTPVPIITLTGTVRNASYTSQAISGATISFLGVTTVTGSNPLHPGDFSLQVRAITSDTLPLYARAAAFNPGTKQIPRLDTYNAPTTISLGNIDLIPQQCTVPSAAISNVLQQGSAVQLIYGFVCKPTSYQILRGSSTTTINTVMTYSTDPAVLQYSDTQIIGGAHYCYEIKAHFANQDVISAPQCIDVGAQSCFDGEKSFCDKNTLKTCTKAGTQMLLGETSCPDGNICVQKDSKTAQCVPSQICDLCNRPFDVFANFGEAQPPQFSSIFGGIGSNLTLFDFKKTGNNIFYCAQQSVTCYLDYSKTIVDKYYSCEDISSCYDFASEATCTGNQHRKCIPDTCEWVTSAYGELGVGVCRPVDKSKQQCHAFETTQTKTREIQNTVFASNVCALFGDSCYFSVIRDRCLNKDEVACYDYGNTSDCVGSRASARQAQVNVTWKRPFVNGHIGSTYFKMNGTNNVTKRSRDHFSIGICKILNGACVRDADDNQNNTYYNPSNPKYPLESPTGGSYTFEDVGAQDIRAGRDCQSNTTDPTCATDVAPPRTLLAVADGAFINYLTFNYSIIDNSIIQDVQNQNRIKTWFRTVPSNETDRYTTYPNQPTDVIHKKIQLRVGDGPWAIFYFSEDRSHNLELVKRTDVTIDRLAPVINFSYAVIPNLNEHKITFIPKLTLLTSKTGDTFAYCTMASLSRSDGISLASRLDTQESTIGTAARANWTETYRDIETQNGIIVTYSWNCHDGAGNVAPGSIDVPLDADMTISDPQPRIAVHARTGISISIKTLQQYPGECRYSDSAFTGTNANYRATTGIFASVQTANGDFIHTAAVDVPTVHNKIIYVACNLTGIQGIVRGSDVDNIALTIDDIPPRTLAFDPQGNPTVFSALTWVNGNNINLQCNDTQQRLTGYPHEIGCGRVYSCTDQSAVPCSPHSNPENQIVTPPLTASTTLRYYSIDKYGNNETVNNGNVPIAHQIRFDGDAPDIILPASLQVESISTPLIQFLLLANISNEGVDVAPLQYGGSHYEIRNNTGILSNGTIYLDPNHLDIPLIQIVQPITLQANQVNSIFITSADQAGNSRTVGPIRVIQDSSGPDLDNALIEKETRFGTSQTLNIEFGDDFPAKISNVIDRYPLPTDDRVSQVWLEDMFGARYGLTKDPSDAWHGTVQTHSWLPSNKFNTFVTIFANDTLGNIAQKEVNITIEDHVRPTAVISLENKYGQSINTIVPGENYVVLKASESLENVTSFYFKIGTKQYNASFIVRDLDALTWIGLINVPQGVTGPLQINGVMYDSNGLRSSVVNAFTPETSLILDTAGFRQPLPIGTNSYYNDAKKAFYVRSATISYGPLETLDYQYTVNANVGNTLPVGLKQGSNDVTIRAENANGIYRLFSQKVNANTTIAATTPIDTTPPTITSANVGYARLTVFPDGKIISRNQTIAMEGSYNPTDATAVYVIGQDGKRYDASLNSGRFTIDPLRLVGRTFEEVPNNLVLVFEDAAGNKAQYRVTIIKDLKPPYLISLLFKRV